MKNCLLTFSVLFMKTLSICQASVLCYVLSHPTILIILSHLHFAFFKVGMIMFSNFLNVRFLSPAAQLETCSHQCDKTHAEVSLCHEGLKTYFKSLGGCRLNSVLVGLAECFLSSVCVCLFVFSTGAASALVERDLCLAPTLRPA